MKIIFCYAFETAKYGFLDDAELAFGKNWKKRIFESILTDVFFGVYSVDSANSYIPGHIAKVLGRVLIAVDSAETDFIEIPIEDFQIIRQSFSDNNVRVGRGRERAFSLFYDSVTDGNTQF